MIINFCVTNFGPFKETQTLSFEATDSTNLEEYYVVEPFEGLRVLKIGFIFGPNASGKTTILDALDFLKHLVVAPFDNKTNTFDFEPFLFDEESKTKNTSFSLEFVFDKIKYYYEVEFNKYAIVKENLYFYAPNKALVYSRETDEEKQLAVIKFGSKIKIKKENVSNLSANTLWNNTVLGGFVKTNIEVPELQNVLSWFYKILSHVVYPKSDLQDFVTERIEDDRINKKNVVKILKKADLLINDIVIETKEKDVDPDIVNFLFKAIKPKNEELVTLQKTNVLKQTYTYFEHLVSTEQGKKSYVLDHDQESLGTQRFYGFAGIMDLMINNEKIFPIDEVECSLHPDLLEYYILLFLVNAKQSQLILSTHYRELLLKKDILRNDALWFTQKDETGSAEIYSLSDFDSSVVRNTSSIYNAYKIGKLGAVPNLGDYFIDIENGEK